MQFKPGDVVQLHSDSKQMTVNMTIADEVECVWHTNDGNIAFATFTPDALEMVSPKPAS